MNAALVALGFTNDDYRLEDHLDGKEVKLVWLSTRLRPNIPSIISVAPPGRLQALKEIEDAKRRL